MMRHDEEGTLKWAKEEVRRTNVMDGLTYQDALSILRNNEDKSLSMEDAHGVLQRLDARTHLQNPLDILRQLM